MSKELEALNRIIRFFNSDFSIKNYSIDDARKDLDTIISALKRLVEHDKIFKKYDIDDLKVLDKVLEVQRFLVNHDYSTLPREEFDLLFRQIKVLEVFKNIFTFAVEFRHWGDKVVYNLTIFDKRKEKSDELLHKPLAVIIITQEEYDLLKEVLV